ncbi:glycosyltransferase [Kitasatospora sp. NPDC056181]|uniref:glycosyltransferase n=1 Tax=Kitasatospora sp. NPDC056181 TaxID=3345737 RepID=UPI0035D559C8
MVTAAVPHPPVPWVVVTDYPRWPSPYFTQFERAVGGRMELRFQPGLDGLEAQAPGVLNLHRLKRLYRDAGGTADPVLAAELVRRLYGLRRQGWRIVWTVHNLYPIDVPQTSEADLAVVSGLLAVADTVLCHTRADAAHVRGLPGVGGRVAVCGWAGLPAPAAPTLPPGPARLAAAMADSRAFLLAGNISAYKDVPGVIEAFLRAEVADGQLYVVGPCRDQELEAAVTDLARRSDRVHRWAGRVDPGHVRHLHDAAAVAVCNYRTDGGQRFFTQAIHPSSVGTAVVCGVPLVAPALSSIREMTQGHPAYLHESPADLPASLALAAAHPDTRWGRPEPDETGPWEAIAEAHLLVAGTGGSGPAHRVGASGVGAPDPGTQGGDHLRGESEDHGTI